MDSSSACAGYVCDSNVLCCVAGLAQSAGDGEETRQPTLQGKSGSRSMPQVAFPLSAAAASPQSVPWSIRMYQKAH